MYETTYTGDIATLLAIAQAGAGRVACYYSENHKVYELVSEEETLVWHADSGKLKVFARFAVMIRLRGLIENFERAKARGERMELPELHGQFEIAPMPTVHTVSGAYNVLYAFYGEEGAQRGAPAKINCVSDGARSPGGVLMVAHMHLAWFAKPFTAEQDNLCWDFSVYLDQAEKERVHPDKFERWIGKDVLNKWTIAARRLRMPSEMEVDWHYRNYLSDREEAEFQALMSRSALH